CGALRSRRRRSRRSPATVPVRPILKGRTSARLAWPAGLGHGMITKPARSSPAACTPSPVAGGKICAMARIAPLSGFPEWLPADRRVESAVLAHVRHVFELHGFAEIETRAVEPVERLLSKGETSKEIYLLRRLQEEAGSTDEGGLGLHFDLTVPFARYVLENAGRLTFPFKRYQIQKVWRGERPQEGRYREFTQADIDVVGAGTLPFHYEVELPLVMAEALTG